MKKIGLIGAYEGKADLLLNIAKVLTVAGKSVLIIDASTLQKTKYIVPTISPDRSYITTFEKFDVAVGFESIEALENYLLVVENQKKQYDIILVDLDTYQAFENFNMQSAEPNYFVTAFDAYSIKKGTQVLNAIKEPMSFTKILFSNNMLKEDNAYLEHITTDSNIKWKEEMLYFPITIEDMLYTMENQKTANIRLKRYSSSYKESLNYLIQQIEPDLNKKATKIIKSI